MRGDHHIVGMAVGKELQSRVLQLHAHYDGEDTTDEATHHGKGQVHGADVFVIGGLKPTPQSGRSVFESPQGSRRRNHLISSPTRRFPSRKKRCWERGFRGELSQTR